MPSHDTSSPPGGLARAICIPTKDIAFTRIVERVLATHAPAAPDELARLLSASMPSVSVRPRDISAEGPVWYVYRDGHFSSDSDIPWWHEPGVARAVWSSEDGTLTESNDAFAGIMSAPLDDMIGRFYADFIFPESAEHHGTAYRTVLEEGEAHSLTRMRRFDGQSIILEYYATCELGNVAAYYREVNLRRNAGPTERARA